MPKCEKVYADEYIFFVVKTVWKWKKTFHFNLYIRKEHIIFYLIWYILCILELVFQMAHRKIVPRTIFLFAHPAAIELVASNL